jgi:predicted nucleic acid-binding Zn ribbon protein
MINIKERAEKTIGSNKHVQNARKKQQEIGDRKRSMSIPAADRAAAESQRKAEEERAAREAYTKDQVRRRSLMGTNDAMGTS